MIYMHPSHHTHTNREQNNIKTFLQSQQFLQQIQPIQTSFSINKVQYILHN